MTTATQHETPDVSRRLTLDDIGAALLAATLLVAVVFSSVEYAGVQGSTGPDAVASAFTNVRG